MNLCRFPDTMLLMVLRAEGWEAVIVSSLRSLLMEADGVAAPIAVFK